MAVPAEFVCYVERQAPATASSSSKRRRAAVAAVLLAVAICAAALLVSSPSGKSVGRVNFLTMKRSQTTSLARAHDVKLATQLIRAAPHSSVQSMELILKHWQDHMVSNLDADVSRGLMLAMVPKNIETALEESGKLCEKKDIIFSKFSQLLAKLSKESKTRNETDQTAHDAQVAATEAWLDSESEYRLEEEKKKEALDGASYARAEYEKWAETVKRTSERLATMQTNYDKEMADINSQRSLIQEILRLFGVLGSEPLDSATANAGGYMASEKAHPLTLKEIKSKISLLRQEAVNGGAIKLQLVNQLESKLANYAETDEVKKLLSGMISDLNTREEVISSALKQTQEELEKHKKKLVDYETQVVDLSNAADKAQESAAAQDLKRQALNGKKKDASENYKNEHAEYVIVAPPADRAITILEVIMKKINEFCAASTSQ
ncbi:hypothetical protein GUITHDRAFT_138550 [Guillardia theta CCMP2712]|uniref:Uncharacterized protein n=1 Tax=Guillardia theta (strain CCMP2712) TaxID=905079 RepID=L1JD91_GUITC|nr:hypothetical protein GUITHDRAFT_138550 [Guillardia theta CCMP2712]EKX46075.1 hypothetical protein GUITHDRAFT_138550 [Guillardia theta CCMP2712]|eukprot:XP_005833055.1 hypothetical protein GUITHDRAFT_138550 [Guillardia theta CCMP2712]